MSVMETESVTESGAATTAVQACNTYELAVANGFYQRDTGGLIGKYDNVRRYWEDQITRYALHDFIEPLTDRKRRQLARVRVLDLGAGSGEGYEILTSLKKKRDTLASKEIDVLPSEILGYYKGIDVSPAMVEQGQRIYADVTKVDFEAGDLSHGLGEARRDPPYDIYFSSYGSLSHLRDDELERLVEDICAHAAERCVFVADLVGRYSFEWQCYWDQPGIDDTNMRQYSMSYLYPPEVLQKIEVERFPLRYWSRQELDTFLERVVAGQGAQISKKLYWDRSVLVGRHMNTGEFNRHAQPIRAAVSSLHEFNCRTDLTTLLFDYSPHLGFPELNAFFERFQVAWNTVVYAALEALEHWDDPAFLRQEPPADYPDILRESIRTIRNVIRNIQWFRMGDPRANVFEPQLGYILRNLEMDLQQGLGAAHGLLAVVEIQKP
jgi:SAM-dependent methyltransferase